jgi:hypothetical protein
MKKFEVGNTYSTRSACDHECIFSYTVKKRTAKFLWLENKRGEQKRRGIYAHSGIEYCKPEGTYSMCPVISAD